MTYLQCPVCRYARTDDPVSPAVCPSCRSRRGKTVRLEPIRRDAFLRAHLRL